MKSRIIMIVCVLAVFVLIGVIGAVSEKDKEDSVPVRTSTPTITPTPEDQTNPEGEKAFIEYVTAELNNTYKDHLEVYKDRNAMIIKIWEDGLNKKITNLRNSSKKKKQKEYEQIKADYEAMAKKYDQAMFDNNIDYLNCGVMVLNDEDLNDLIFAYKNGELMYPETSTTPTEEPTQAPTEVPAEKDDDKNSKAKKTEMTLNIGTTRSDSNSIGNEWTYEYEVNGEKAKSGGKYSISVGDKITVYSKITENDTNPDIGEKTSSYTVKEEDVKNGFEISIDVKVTENAGRNSGKSATYKVTFKFKK